MNQLLAVRKSYTLVGNHITSIILEANVKILSDRDRCSNGPLAIFLLRERERKKLLTSLLGVLQEAGDIQLVVEVSRLGLLAARHAATADTRLQNWQNFLTCYILIYSSTPSLRMCDYDININAVRLSADYHNQIVTSILIGFDPWLANYLCQYQLSISAPADAHM